MSVCPFSFECCLEEAQLPTLTWLEQAVAEYLPAGSEALHWAIVRTALDDKRLWIEGAYLSSAFSVQ